MVEHSREAGGAALRNGGDTAGVSRGCGLVRWSSVVGRLSLVVCRLSSVVGRLSSAGTSL
jgi:hypothetical protein